MTQLRSPKWLPHAVAAFGGWIVEEGLPPVLRLRRKRLMTDPRMEFVWHQLEQEKRRVSEDKGRYQVHHDQITAAVEAFLRGYLYKAITADTDAPYWHSAPGAREQRVIMRQIGKRARELLNLLGDPRQHYKWTPWDRLTAGLIFARNAAPSLHEAFKHLANKTYGRYWSVGGSIEREPLDSAQQSKVMSFFPDAAQALLGDLPSQLRGLAVLAELSGAADRATPTKPPYKTKQLRHTVYARNLARDVIGQGLLPRQSKHRQGGFPLYQIIAITTNVALELSSIDELRPDTVRKLVVEDRKR